MSEAAARRHVHGLPRGGPWGDIVTEAGGPGRIEEPVKEYMPRDMPRDKCPGINSPQGYNWHDDTRSIQRQFMLKAVFFVPGVASGVLGL